jgi:hypothetical protein
MASSTCRYWCTIKKQKYLIDVAVLLRTLKTLIMEMIYKKHVNMPQEIKRFED